MQTILELPGPNLPQRNQQRGCPPESHEQPPGGFSSSQGILTYPELGQAAASLTAAADKGLLFT